MPKAPKGKNDETHTLQASFARDPAHSTLPPYSAPLFSNQKVFTHVSLWWPPKSGPY